MTSFPEKKSFFNLFPTPEYLLLSSGGIAITDDSVKFVQFRRSLFGQSLKLSSYEKFPLEAGVAQSGYINNAEKLTEVLGGLSKKHDISFARATFPEERAYLFSAFIDRVPQKGLRDAVAFIVEANVPVQLANSVFDFDVIEDDLESNKIKVVVAVLSKKVVDFYIQIFESAGITPVSFDIESQAIARAVVPRGDSSTQMVVNLAINKTGFYIVEDEVVQFTTTLPIGATKESPYSHMNDLVVEMRKIFGFWSSRASTSGNGARKIEKVLLCGTNASNEEFIKEFMKECPVSYSVANPWINISDGYQHLSAEDISQDALDYTSAIGVAMARGIKTNV